MAAAPLAGIKQLQFVPNRGQWSSPGCDQRDQVRFAVLGDTVGWLHDDGFSLRLERWSQQDEREPVRRCSGAVVRTRFVGAETLGFVPGQEFGTRHNFLRNGLAQHVRDVPSFASVTMRQVLPGIDVCFRSLPGDGAASPSGAFEYDLLLAPGADLSSFEAVCEGVHELRIDASGRLVAVVSTPEGPQELLQQAPIAWQQGPDGKQPVTVRFRLLSGNRYGFVAEHLHADLPTVVDPGVIWGTFLGGGATDRIHDMTYVDGDGVWVGGWTGSADFPATVGAFQTTGAADAMVAKLSDDGQSLVFATYLGGSKGEEVRGIAVAADQTATVVGFTNSADFPTTPGAAQSTYGGGSFFLDIGDAFVTRLSSNGATLLSSTYAGGLFDDVAEDVTLDPVGNAIVAGWTSSTDFPMPPGGFQPALGGLPLAQSDGFVLGVTRNGQAFSFGSFAGGQLGEQFLGIDRDPLTGDLVVAGWSLGADYPVTPSVVRPSSSGGIDAVLTRFNPTASAAVFSTYMGGIGEDAGQAVRFDVDGSVWLAGYTNSTNYPATLTAPQQVLGGANDGFLTRISSSGQSLVFSTLLGGPGQDRVRDLDLAATGMIVVGEAGAGFPVTNDAVQSQFAFGITDGFVAYYTNDGATLSWASYFGGDGQDSLQAVDLSDSGFAVAAGYTYSADFPIAPAAYQGQLLGVEDGVVVKLDLLTTLGAAMAVTPVSLPLVQLASSGEVQLLEFDLENVSDRAVIVESVRVYVGAVGAAPGNVAGLRVARSVAAAGDPQTVGFVSDVVLGGETLLPLLGVTLPAKSTQRFVVTVDVGTSANSLEVAAAIVDRLAWQVRAVGLGNGPDVSVQGAGSVRGPVMVFGAIAGDVDGSGTRDVVDVRRMANRIGSADALADVDGDGMLTAVDIEATARAVLGRGSVFSMPTQVARDGWLAVNCLLPSADTLQVVLGGRSLTVAQGMPRQIAARIPADQSVGLQEIVISLSDQTVFSALIEVL